jgi:hypothetical protein
MARSTVRFLPGKTPVDAPVLRHFGPVFGSHIQHPFSGIPTGWDAGGLAILPNFGPMSEIPRPKVSPMTDREKILIALREKPLKAFEVMKRVNIKNQDDCQSLLLKMRDDGVVKFDIHNGHWLAA